MKTLVVKLVPKIESCDVEKVLKITALLNWHAEEADRLTKELNEELSKAELRLTKLRD